MLLILLAMIVGSSLTAFSLPSATSAASGLSGIRITPQKPAAPDTPFAAPLASPNLDTTKPAPRGSVLNLSV